jgi:lysophospholipase L1-like esterase
MSGGATSRRWRVAVMMLATSGAFGGCSQIASQGSASISTATPTRVASCDRPEPDDVCLLILGDSIAAGWPLTGPNQWWMRLREALTTALGDRQVMLQNLAVPGSGIATLEAAAAQREGVATHDVVLIIEGVNDNEVVPLEAWKGRYAAVVATLEEAGSRVVIGTPPPSFEDGGFRTRYLPIAAALRDIAGERVSLLDLDASFRADGASRAAAYYSDILHQTAAGQARMAELATPIVLALIEP